MILITGATGELGKLVIEKLLNQIPSDNIVALVRDTNKAKHLTDKNIQLRIGDYNDTNSLEQALKGVDKVLLISSNDVINRLNQHKNVIDSAKKAGVKHLVYISGFLLNPETSTLKMPMAALVQTEAYLKESGLTFTILQNTLYMENISKYVGAKVLETGIFFPAGEGKVAFATRADLAEATAKVLVTNGHENNTYKLTGAVSYSFGEIASELSKLSGKNINYVSPEPTVFIETLKKLGVPEQLAQVSTMFATAIKNNDCNIVDPTLQTLIGRKTTDLETYLKLTYL